MPPENITKVDIIIDGTLKAMGWTLESYLAKKSKSNKSKPEEIKKMYISVNEYGRMIGRGRHTVTRWVEAGDVKAVILPSGRRGIPISEVEKYKED